MHERVGRSNAGLPAALAARLREAGVTTLPPTGLLALALLLIAAVVLRAPSLGVSVIDWDESVYVLMADAWRHGGLPYVAVWDQHPVGLPALIAVAGAVTGDGLLGGRLAAALAVGFTCWLLARIAALWLRHPLAGWLVALLYLVSMLRADSLPAQTEVFNNTLVALAAAILLGRPGEAPGRWRGLAAGLVLGAALQIKYVVLPEAVLFSLGWLALLWAGGARLSRLAAQAGLLMLGGLLPTALAVLYFWAEGALGAFLQANIGANLAYVGLVPGWPEILRHVWKGLKPQGGLLLAAALLPLAWPGLRGPARRLLPALALWTIAAAIDICLPLKFWRHYFQALLPPLCLAAGAAALGLACRAPPRWRGAVLGMVVLLAALPAVRGAVVDWRVLAARAAHDVPRTVAAAIRRGGTDGHDVYVFNYQPVVYLLAGSSAPTRYVMPSELSAFVGSSGAHPSAELDRILAGRPRWIVVADPAAYPFPPILRARLDTALRHYREARSWSDPTAKGQRVMLYRVEQASQPEASRSPP